ncbi:hypothetical protein B0T24DRAFT_617023 [Lasiosphaeria ovina]|uniref:Uncharacterized protein n=1 Tax=Lasiosphaeria ovina TaxID=92902 RepID=A0AAE0KGY8_9PEZI|nr:hypothetical protein B0T24DRAFT_617023 [Lasiosphaeria ovina]
MPEVPRGVFHAVKKPLDTLVDAYKAVGIEVAILVTGNWYCDGIMDEDHPDHDDDCPMKWRFRDDDSDGDGGGDDCGGDDGGGDADPAEGSKELAAAQDHEDPTEEEEEPDPAADYNLAYSGGEDDWPEHEDGNEAWPDDVWKEDDDPIASVNNLMDLPAGPVRQPSEDPLDLDGE